jgi:hypothetical protein
MFVLISTFFKLFTTYNNKYRLAQGTFIHFSITQNLNLLQKCYKFHMHMSTETWKVVMSAEHVQYDLHSALIPPEG